MWDLCRVWHGFGGVRCLCVCSFVCVCSVHVGEAWYDFGKCI